LLHWFGTRVDIEVVLGEFSWYSGHVRGLPCEDIHVFTQELDERAFLFRVQAGTDGNLLGGVSFLQVHLLSLLSSFERRGLVRNLLLGGVHLFRIHCGPVSLQFFSGDDLLSERSFSGLALLRLLEATGNSYPAVSSRHLELVVDVT